MKTETKDLLENLLTEAELQQFQEFWEKVQDFLILAKIKDQKIDVANITPLVKELRGFLVTPTERNVKNLSKGFRKLLSNVIVRLIQDSSSPKRKVAEIVLSVAKSKGFSHEEAQAIAAHFYMEFTPFRVGKKSMANSSNKIKSNTSGKLDFDLIEPFVSKILAGDPDGEIAELIAELLLILKPIYSSLYEGLDESYFSPIMEAIYKAFSENSTLFTSEQSLEIAKKNFVTSIF